MLNTEELEVEARLIARTMAEAKGSVTAQAVLDEMVSRGHENQASIDHIFMGSPWEDAGITLSRGKTVTLWQYGPKAGTDGGDA